MIILSSRKRIRIRSAPEHIRARIQESGHSQSAMLLAHEQRCAAFKSPPAMGFLLVE